MKILGKPYKFGSWQITLIIDNFGIKKIQIRLYKKNKNGGLNFQKCQQIYANPKDWQELKKEIKVQ